jgi:hypothetical protein
VSAVRQPAHGAAHLAAAEGRRRSGAFRQLWAWRVIRLDLTDEEREALLRVIEAAVKDSRCPLSPRRRRSSASPRGSETKTSIERRAATMSALPRITSGRDTKKAGDNITRVKTNKRALRGCFQTGSSHWPRRAVRQTVTKAVLTAAVRANALIVSGWIVRAPGCCCEVWHTRHMAEMISCASKARLVPSAGGEGGG